MEVRRLTKFVPSKELADKLEKQKKQKEEACKSFGDFLISITNFCFDKCINTDLMHFSKNEKKCVEDMFNKFVQAHQYTYDKFLNINSISENSSLLERSEDYGDYFGILQTFLGEDLMKKEEKDYQFHKI